MSISIVGNDSEELRVTAGARVTFRLSAYDPSGIGRIYVQCFQFSMTSSTRAKMATGEVHLTPREAPPQEGIYEVSVVIPENAAPGKWGVQLIEFTNGRGFKTSFYRGHGKFDHVVFEVVPQQAKEDELLRFDGVEIATVGNRN
ncbi:MAG TPA: hypothetical protein VKM94_25270 [Blastocatellia bacterium]|nr:hypothetical protein [Blastocatellia bacterium]